MIVLGWDLLSGQGENGEGERRLLRYPYFISRGSWGRSWREGGRGGAYRWRVFLPMAYRVVVEGVVAVGVRRGCVSEEELVEP